MKTQLFPRIAFLVSITLLALFMPSIMQGNKANAETWVYKVDQGESNGGASVPTDNLVGEYLLNEGSGNVMYDSSGYGRHGTIYGAQWVTSPIADNNGQPGYALQFNKTYASVPSDALKHLPLSISLWVKPDANVNDKRNNIISNDRPFSAGHGIGINQNRYVYVEYEGSGAFRNTSYQIQWGQWYHIVAVYESGNVKTYINSQLVDNFSYTQQSLDAENSFLIGRHNFDSSLGDRVFFNGVVDAIRIYHKALSPEEIQELYGDTPSNDPLFPNQWYLNKIDILGAWSHTRGSSNVVVAVIDTGVDYNHVDLSNGKTLTDNDKDFVKPDDDAMDDNGHGTHVAGIIAANTNNGYGIAGVCPQCRILPLKAMNKVGDGDHVNVASAIEYAIDAGASVINVSLGVNTCYPDVAAAVNHAYNDGVVFVASAGNVDCPVKVALGLETFEVGYPARFERVIAVGATTKFDGRAITSNYGTSLDISAPGVDILRTCKRIS